MLKTNEVIKTILERRSVRKYLPEPVAQEDLEVLWQAALYAPTGGNHQYTRFITVTNLEVLTKINTIVHEEFAKRELDPTDYQNKTVIKAKQPDFNCLYHAPLLITAVSPTKHGNSMADSANALENIQLAATSLGLGSCWVNQLHWLTDNPRMHAYLLELGMQEDESVFGSVIVGHAAEELVKARPARKEGRIVVIK